MRATPAETLMHRAAIPPAHTTLTSKGAPRQATVRLPGTNAPGCSNQPIAISGKPIEGVRPGVAKLNRASIRHRQKMMPRVPPSFCWEVNLIQFNIRCFLENSGMTGQAGHGWQLQQGFRIGRGKTAVGRFQARQPRILQVFAGTQGNHRIARHLHAEHVFRIARHARCIAVAPDGVDLVDIRQLPVAQHDVVAIGDDTGLLEQLARRRLQQRLVDGVDGTGHRLPKAGLARALDQQHVELARMDNDQYGNGNFMAHIKNEKGASSAPFLYSLNVNLSLLLLARRRANGCAIRAVASRPLPTALVSAGTGRAGFSGRRSRRGSIRNRSSWSRYGPGRMPGRLAVARRIAVRPAGSRTSAGLLRHRSSVHGRPCFALLRGGYG